MLFRSVISTVAEPILPLMSVALHVNKAFVLYCGACQIAVSESVLIRVPSLVLQEYSNEPPEGSMASIRKLISSPVLTRVESDRMLIMGISVAVVLAKSPPLSPSASFSAETGFLRVASEAQPDAPKSAIIPKTIGNSAE